MGVHGEKILATINSDKLPAFDKPRMVALYQVYETWVSKLKSINKPSLDEIVVEMVSLLNDYKNHLDINIIFDSKEDFLYRQKGQLKLDNTVIEEFLPYFVEKCLQSYDIFKQISIDAQTKTFSSIYFKSSLNHIENGGGIELRTKDQDFSISKKLYIKSSHSPLFNNDDTVTLETNLGYVTTEIKTNLDKTMFQEAAATAHDIKLAVTGAKYFLLCEWLDMTPIPTSTTYIDEIIILRKAKRMNSNLRNRFSNFQGRQEKKDFYIEYLRNNPYDVLMFKRYINHIIALINNEELVEGSVLNIGYF